MSRKHTCLEHWEGDFKTNVGGCMGILGSVIRINGTKNRKAIELLLSRCDLYLDTFEDYFQKLQISSECVSESCQKMRTPFVQALLSQIRQMEDEIITQIILGDLQQEIDKEELRVLKRALTLRFESFEAQLEEFLLDPFCGRHSFPSSSSSSSDQKNEEAAHDLLHGYLVCNLRCVRAGPLDVEIAWKPPVSLTAEHMYEVAYRLQGHDGAWDVINELPSPHCNISNLKPGHQYRVRCRVFHALEGWGPYCSPISCATMAAAPPAPVEIEVLRTTHSSCILRWKMPSSFSVDSFELSYSLGSDIWSVASSSIKSSPIRKKNLHPNTEYQFRVRACSSSGGWGPCSAAVTTKTQTFEAYLRFLRQGAKEILQGKHGLSPGPPLPLNGRPGVFPVFPPTFVAPSAMPEMLGTHMGPFAAHHPHGSPPFMAPGTYRRQRPDDNSRSGEGFDIFELMMQFFSGGTSSSSSPSPPPPPSHPSSSSGGFQTNPHAHTGPNPSSSSSHPAPRDPRRLGICVRRHRLLEDSFDVLATKDAKDWARDFFIRFQGEEGSDYGALLREWLTLLMQQLTDPHLALFKDLPHSHRVHPDPRSVYQFNHLGYFYLCGRALAKAFLEDIPIPMRVSTLVLKSLLGQSPVLSDLQAFDPELHTNLTWMLSNDIEGVVDETFTATTSMFGALNETELLPNGKHTHVTNENKARYCELRAVAAMSAGIEEQVGVLLKGFSELVPLSLLSYLSVSDLEIALSGLVHFSVIDLKKNTSVSNDFAASRNTHIVDWFWGIVGDMPRDYQSRLLFFTTGSTSAPPGGFAQLRPNQFRIEAELNAPEGALPVAHSCFNTLCLPVYFKHYETMREKLIQAILETEGFGLV